MKENGNKFLESQRVVTDEIFTSGDKTLKMKYPLFTQQQWIKNELFNNINRIIAEGSFVKEVDVYRYVLKNLCYDVKVDEDGRSIESQMSGIDNYDDNDLMDLLFNGKYTIKRLRWRIDDLLAELLEDALSEIKNSTRGVNLSIEFAKIKSEESIAMNKLNDFLVKNNIDISKIENAKDKEEALEIIKELFENINIKENLSK